MRVIIALFAVIASLFMISPTAQAQVTASSIRGLVKDDKGAELPGATVVATHVPSGSKYGTVTNERGRYVLPSVRVGGPYKVTVTFVGFKEQSKEDIFASLGAASDANFTLVEDGKDIQEVVVTSGRSDIFSSGRTGAATTLGLNAVNSLPTPSVVRLMTSQNTMPTATVVRLRVRTVV